MKYVVKESRRNGRAFVKCSGHPVFGDNWVIRSHFIWWKFRRQLVPAGWHLHHKDEDKLHDAMSNLRLMTRAEHARLHQAGNKDGPQTPAHRAAIKAALMGRAKTEAHKANMRKPKSEAGRLAIAASNKSRGFTLDALRRMSRLGSKHSEATKQAMSRHRKGVRKSEAHRMAIKAAWARKKMA